MIGNFIISSCLFLLQVKLMKEIPMYNLGLMITIFCSFLGQGERKLSVLVGYFLVFVLHVIGLPWWYWNEDMLNPLIMVPPKAIPPFWHAMFTILVNGMNYSLSSTVIYLLEIQLSVVLIWYRCIFLDCLIHLHTFVSHDRLKANNWIQST